MSCPACDKGQKRACTCGGKRKYTRRALDGVEELLDGDTAAAAPPRAPPPPDPEVAPPGETAAAAGDEPEPDPRMMGLRAPPSDARAAHETPRAGDGHRGQGPLQQAGRHPGGDLGHALRLRRGARATSASCRARRSPRTLGTAILERPRAKRAIKFKLSLDIFRRKCGKRPTCDLHERGNGRLRLAIAHSARENLGRVAQNGANTHWSVLSTRRHASYATF